VNPSNDISKISLNENIVSMTCGNNLSAVLTKNGRVLMWNCEDMKPKEMRCLKRLNIKHVLLSSSHCAIVTNEEELFYIPLDELEFSNPPKKIFQSSGHISHLALGWNFGLLVSMELD